MQTVPGEAGNLFYSPGITDMPNDLFYHSTNAGSTWSAVAHVGAAYAFGFGAAAPGHRYPAIYMAGWLYTTSSTSATIGTGSFTFTVGNGFHFTAGSPVNITNGPFRNSPQLNGTITSYNSATGSLVANIASTIGSGRYSSWTVSVYGIWRSIDQADTWTQLGPWPMNSMDGVKTITGDPNIYGQVYVGFAGSGYAYLRPLP
jgi:hypothetical protein